jgi:hypothetical protein
MMKRFHLIMVALLVVIVGGCYGSGNNGGGDGNDLNLPDTGGDGSTVNDGQGDIPGTCECLNPLDECVDDVCVRRDYRCDALHACDPGYECGPDNTCSCVDFDVCGIDCSVTGYCPEGLITSLVCAPDGICRPVLPCVSHQMCPEGQLCIRLVFDYYSCAPPGTGEVGASCTENTDCRYGVCETGICLASCMLNQDCDPGLLCGDTRYGQLGCMTATDCDACSAPTQVCLSYRCHTGNCLKTADCPGINCTMDIPGIAVNAGQCMDDPTTIRCEGNEFSSMTLFEYCFIHQACWNDSDCTPPYVCVPLHSDVGVGFCGRNMQP